MKHLKQNVLPSNMYVTQYWFPIIYLIVNPPVNGVHSTRCNCCYRNWMKNKENSLDSGMLDHCSIHRFKLCFPCFFKKYILSPVLALHFFDAFAYYCQARKNNDWSSFSRTGENSGWLCFLIRPRLSHIDTYIYPCHNPVSQERESINNSSQMKRKIAMLESQLKKNKTHQSKVSQANKILGEWHFRNGGETCIV